MPGRRHPFALPFPPDDTLLNAIKRDGTARMRCCAYPETAVVAGHASRMDDEIRLGAVLDDGVPVYRRKGGGCAVVLDPGNLIVSAVFPAKGYLNVHALFNRAVRWLTNGLLESGITDVYRGGISDIVLNNKKVGGTCFYRARDIAYFSASLLVNADLELIRKYLKTPPRQPAYRNGRSHLDFLANLSSYATGLDVKRFSRVLEGRLDPRDLLAAHPAPADLKNRGKPVYLPT